MTASHDQRFFTESHTGAKMSSSPSFQAGLVEQFVLGVLADEVQHRGDGDAADQAVVVDDRRRHEVSVALEGLGGGFGLVGGFGGRGVGERFRSPRFRVVHQQPVEAAARRGVRHAIDDEELVGVVGRGFEEAPGGAARL